jgi:dipeptidyl-peptidase-4
MRGWLAGAVLMAGTMSGGAAMADTPAQPQAQALTLERVFGSPDLAGPQPQALKISPDGALVTSVRPRADARERFDLWTLDPRTGEERMLVDSAAVGSGAELSEAAKMQRERDRTLTGKTGVLQYDWSPDGKTLLFPLDGDLFLADRGGKARALGVRDALNPTVSPRGEFISFVRDQNLFVQPLSGGEARGVTQDGGGTVHWGEAEFVAQEEMDRRTGHWWSPDERWIAVERFDEAPVQVSTRAAIGASGTKLYEQRYPAAGTPNVLVELWVVRADGGARVKVDLGADPDIYLARVAWGPDGTLYVQRQNRAQTRLDLLKVDLETGKTATVFTEAAGPNSWVNLSNGLRALRDGSLIWWSERDGHGHLYRWKAGSWTQLTRGDWEVSGLVGVDEGKGRLFFTGNRDGVLERHVYAIDLARPGEPERLTEAGWWNGATMDAGATRMIVTRSNRGQPPQTYLADAAGKRLAWINRNAVEGAHPYAPYLAAHRPTTYGTTTAEDGTLLHWQMITPRLEPGRRYPVFFPHYGGPHVQTVDRQWGGALQQYLVSRGWIFFQIDNRGAANRGKAFEDAIFHAMGSVEVADQRAGARHLATLPFVDAKRIATYGWSYGGYMTVKMLEAEQGLYAAGVAGAPVTDWRLYDTHYTERYMGDPRTDGAAYDRSGGIAQAGKIADPLLLIHGMADDNVFLDNSTQLAGALQRDARPFEMMLYPGQTHRVGGPGVSVHLWTTILDFLDRRIGTVTP